MTRIEFLNRLREALETEVSPQVLRENLDYYSQYINEEIRSGKSEAEVLDSLGDPWAIARTIIDAGEAASQGGYVYESTGENYRRAESPKGTMHIFGIDKWWKILLLAVIMIAVLLLAVTIVGGVISLIAPLAIPLFIIAIVIKVFSDRR